MDHKPCLSFLARSDLIGLFLLLIDQRLTEMQGIPPEINSMKSHAGKPRMKDSRIMDANVLDTLSKRLILGVASQKRSGTG